MFSTNLLVVVLAIGVVAQVLAQSNEFTLVYNGANYTIVNGSDAGGVATAVYENKISTTGWAFLTMTSNSSYSDYDQMYGAGYLEGALTPDLIWAYYNNIFVGEYNATEMSPAVEEWIQENLKYMASQINENPNDTYWQHISLILTQLQGVMDGYNAYANASQQLTLMDFMLINMDGDMADVMAALNASFMDWSNDMDVIENYIYNTHCSVLVKLADDLSDIFAGHTTWEGYYEMVRVFKTYNLPISVAQSSPVVMFSGYPGSLSSVDDFYQTNSKLMITETTNGIMNNTLYNAVTPNSVLSFLRVILSNKVASSGQEWVETFAKYNSGTYNNQWIIVDMKKLNPGVSVEPGTLWILEQIPGYTESADVTQILSYGYWPSYNVPYFANIYNVSGFPYYAREYGTFFTYENNPRAEIFRRYGNTVEDIEDIQWMLRYNDYKHDKLEDDNAAWAISSRFDLLPNNASNPMFVRSPFGGVDSKVTSYTSIQNMECWIQSGPTHDDTPPFEYTEEWASQPRMGQPKKWDFDWVDVVFTP